MLQSNTRVFLYTYYIYRLYIYIDEKTRFYAFTLLRPMEGAGSQRKACGAIYVQEMALCVKQKPSRRSFDMNA
jgi:hypothetical protein